MKKGHYISVIIPTLNEEQAIGKVISAIPNWVDDILVVDNGSTDRTAQVAASHGARIISEPQRGYGAACLAGMSALKKETSIVVFLDGDFSDYPEEMHLLVDPVLENQVRVAIGSRVTGQSGKGALTPQAIFGNWLACYLMRLFWGVRYTDLGPFRAIQFTALKNLHMQDRNYGWTVEMQIKAAQQQLPYLEVPVKYRKRIGKSKISGTIQGIIGAGSKILSTIVLAAWNWHFKKR